MTHSALASLTPTTSVKARAKMRDAVRAMCVSIGGGVHLGWTDAYIIHLCLAGQQVKRPMAES